MILFFLGYLRSFFGNYYSNMVSEIPLEIKKDPYLNYFVAHPSIKFIRVYPGSFIRSKAENLLSFYLFKYGVYYEMISSKIADNHPLNFYKILNFT